METLKEKIDYAAERFGEEAISNQLIEEMSELTKALASTTLFDGMYYEITYNGDKQEIYFDAYKKWENKCVKLEA